MGYFMFNDLRNKSKVLSEKIKDKAESVKESHSVANIQSLLDEHWTKIESKLVHGFLSVAEERLYDEEFIETAFDKSYELLPTAVRLIISRKRFLAFANSKSDILRQKVTEKRLALNNANSVLGLSLEIKDKTNNQTSEIAI